MLDKYFGFTKIDNELTVIQSLIEHSRIDEEELYLIEKLLESFLNKNYTEVDNIHSKIAKIRSDSNRVFEYTEEQIIQANFDFQKQYDLLRIYQRIEYFSSDILELSNQFLILKNIKGQIPKSLDDNLIIISKSTILTHDLFKQALQSYEFDKSSIIKLIHKIVESHKVTSDHYNKAIEMLYIEANENQLKLGNFKAIENIFNKFESLSSKIEQAASSLEWLLIK